jgi:hypothetical protein
LERRGRKCLIAAVLVVTALLPPGAHAFSLGRIQSSGKQGSTCNICHLGGVAPLVRFEGPEQVDAGAVATFRFIVQSQSPNQRFAGFNVAADAGQLNTVAGQGELLLAGELTHSTPKANTDGVASFEFTWQAPQSPGSRTLFGAGNSVNRDRSSFGDRASNTTFAVTVAGPPTSTPAEATPTETPVDTPTPTPTMPPFLCIGDCNNDLEVTINEVVTGVNILLEIVPFTSCAQLDANWDEAVTIDELVQAVATALTACPLPAGA